MVKLVFFKFHSLMHSSQVDEYPVKIFNGSQVMLAGALKKSVFEKNAIKSPNFIFQKKIY